jgi:glycerol-3-phosphate acyltransferase PlsY
MITKISLALAALITAYLSGSVSYATLITRLVTGKDIRQLGNKNPGTTNVIKSVGKGWGVLVGFLDGMKGLVPILIFHLFLYKEVNSYNFLILYLMGSAAVLGHCKPVFHHFKGGGGIGVMQGVSLFFIPLEYLISMLTGGIISILFFGKTKRKFSQWTPIFFVTLAPFLTMFINKRVYIPLFAHISLGGHPDSVPWGALILSILILSMNLKFLKLRKQEMNSLKKNQDWDSDTPVE